MLLLLACASSSSRAQELAPEVLKRAKAGTVLVESYSPRGGAQGSGFFVSDRVVVTNAHVLGMLRRGAPRPTSVVVILHSGVPGQERRCPVKVVGVDSTSDLAFLRAEGGVAAVSTITVDPRLELRETLPIYAFGFPFGTSLTGGRSPAVTVQGGSISSVRLGRDGSPAEVQINGNLNPGNSGGPILDAQGRLVAVSVAAIEGTTISFGIPHQVLEQDLAGRALSLALGRVRRAERTYTVEVAVPVLDPLGRLERVAVRTWTQPEAERLPAEARPAKRAHALAWEEGRERCRGEVVQEVPQGEVLWIETVVVPREGAERATEARPLPQLPQLLSPPPTALAPTAPAPTAPAPAPAAAADAPVVAKVLEPRRPAGLKPVPSCRVLDREGHELDLLEPATQSVRLPGGRPLALVAAPDGAEVYGIHEGQSEVVVYDPLTLERRASIPAPRSPVALQCDAERLIVACAESRVVLVIDRATRAPAQVVRLPGDREHQPTGLVGRAPDGSYLSVWSSRQSGTLLLGTPPGGGDTRQLRSLTNEIPAVVVLAGGRLLITSSGGAWVHGPGDPSGLRKEPSVAEGLQPWLRDVSSCSRTHDERHVLLCARQHAPRTFVTSLDLQRVHLELPGHVIAEVPHERLLVAWGPEPSWAGRRKMEVRYIGRHSGRTLRLVRPEDGRAGPSAPTDFYRWRTCFVPGSERLLYFSPYARDPQVLVLPCGPLQDPLRATPAHVVDVSPPSQVRAGEAVSFTPRLADCPAGATVVFELRAGPAGASVDAQTGTLSWSPTALDIGRWDLEIVAQVGAATLRVTRFVLEVVEAKR
ncbi:MAG: trypsin-like peptidase domain-containing protein [Planctomycetota bacterium]